MSTPSVDEENVVVVVVPEPKVEVFYTAEDSDVVALVEGTPGPQGLVGPQGDKGDKGDKGDPGVGITGVADPLKLDSDTGVISLDGSGFDPAGSSEATLEQARAYTDYLAANIAAQKITYTQNVASNNWVINHNLGKKPSVTIVDTANAQVYGDIFYVSNNTLEIHFGSAISGSAYLI